MVFAALWFRSRKDRGSSPLRYLIRLNLDRPFIELQEYVPGIKLSEMGKFRAERCFSTNYPDASRRLINIGKIISGDLLLNNPDRFPLIWDNEGNHTNMLFEVKTDEKIDDELILNPNYTDFSYSDCVAIDTMTYSIAPVDRIALRNTERYLERLEQFLEAMFKDVEIIIQGLHTVNEYSYPSLKRFTAFIYNYTGYDV